ncbi:MAG: dihydrofolate reductase family protein [Chloroflexota bacterium]|nr:dihydrofolate reductase family protein [Chloroflexota bacterium]
MGKLIYCLNVSLDGFVETPDHGLDWTQMDEELHAWFNDRERALDALLYGRRLYEVMTYWGTAEEDPSLTDVERDFARIWNARPKVVFSTSLERVEYNSRLVRGDVGEVLADVRREFTADLGVAGPNLAGQFVSRGLVDEYQLVIHPVVLGAGTPYWPQLETPLRLRLVDSHTFTSGVEYRSYVPV